MRAALLLLALFALPQEDVDALIRQLDDESIEVRERANTALLKMGEKARAALEKAAASGTPELKARVGSILKSLDKARELRGLVTPPLKVSLSGEMTLKEAVESLEKQGGLKTECASWPDGKFRIKLKEVEYWKALEEICRASGKRSLSCEAAGPKLVGDRFTEIPAVTQGIFRLQSKGIAERRTMNLDTGKEEKSFHIFLALAYENPKPPVRFYVTLDSVKDDLGNELVEGFRPNLRFVPKYEQITTPAGKPLFALALELRSVEIPKPEARRIASLSGRVTAYFKGSEESFKMPLGDPGEWKNVFEILDEGQGEPIVGTARYYPGTRTADESTIRLHFKSLDSRLVCDFGDLWILRDRADKTVSGGAGAVSDKDPTAPELHLTFRNLAPGGDWQFLEVALPRRMIRKEIPFDLKDIRIR